jgi:hypothetical protein
MLKQRFFAGSLFTLALLNIMIYIATLMGRIIGPSLVLFMLSNVLFLVFAITKGREPGAPKFGFGPRKRASWKVKLFAGILLGFCIFNVLFVFQAGTPLERDHGFYKKTIGGRIYEIDREEYNDLLKIQARFFSGAWFALNLGAAAKFLPRKSD